MKSSFYKIRGELVTFYADDGLELQGFLARSKIRTKKAIIHIHGLTGAFFRSHLASKLLPKFLSAGYDSFVINTRGYGIISRFKIITGKKSLRMNSGTALERFEDCVKDVRGAIKFLLSQGYRKIILLGHSTGCQKSIYYVHKEKDKRISAIILLAPADDYNVNKKELKGKWKMAVKTAKKLLKKNPNALLPLNLTNNEYLSAQRFLSFGDLSRVESRLFDYESDLKEFQSIRIPTIAIFGSREEYKTKPVSTYLEKLRRLSNSPNFSAIEIKGATHSFQNHEAETANAVINWLNKI